MYNILFLYKRKISKLCYKCLYYLIRAMDIEVFIYVFCIILYRLSIAYLKV